jgi:tripartite ATP-independent transporter DctP family solute receptor
MKSNDKKMFFYLVVTVLVFLLPANAFPESPAKAKYLIRAGYTNPVTHPITEAGFLFRDVVEYRSKGQIKVEVYPNGQLGSNKELAESVRSGTIQMTSVAPPYLTSLVPWFDTLLLPFLWKNYETEWSSFNGWLGNEMSAALKAKGIALVGVMEGGFNQIGNKVRPIEKVGDLKDIKIRLAPSPISLVAFQALGAKAITMDYKEVYTSLESGTIEGIVLGSTYMWNTKFYEVLKYLSICNIQENTMTLLMNNKFLESLPPDLKNIVLEAAAIARDRERARVAGEEAEVLELLRTKTNMKINVISAEQLKLFKKTVMPAYEFGRKKYGQEIVDKLVAAAGE